jgi:acyl carrier protein
LSGHEDIISRISEVAKSLDGISPDVTENITADTNIVRDLKLDSLAVMDFVMAIETKFNTIISIDGIADLKTVGDLANLLELETAQKLQ